MEPDAVKIVGLLPGDVAMFAQGQQRNQRLFASVGRGVEAPKRLQILCPGTGRLDAAMTAVRLQELAEFREQPRYEIIYFTFAEDVGLDRTLIPCFQYCRLLLRPGGRLAFLLPGAGPGGLRGTLSAFLPMSRYAARRSYPADLLRAAGFNDVQVLLRPEAGRIVLGRRPSAPWRSGRCCGK